MDKYTINEITKYLTPNRVLLLTLTHRKNDINHGVWNHIFSDLDKLANWFCSWYQKHILVDDQFIWNGSDYEFNGPVVYDDRESFHNFLTKGYHSGFLEGRHQNNRVSISIIWKPIDSI